MPEARTILLVCTGNSCRSVMPAGLLKEALKGKDDYEIITAGVAAVKGMRPTFEAIHAMFEHKIDVTNHRSMPITDEMFNKADLILVMEKRHKEDILRRIPQAAQKTYLLSEFGRIDKEDKLVDPDIPDPIGKSLEFYRKVFNIIKESVERTTTELTKNSEAK